MADALGLSVRIDHRGDGGIVSIRYRNLDQLDDLAQRLGEKADLGAPRDNQYLSGTPNVNIALWSVVSPVLSVSINPKAVERMLIETEEVRIAVDAHPGIVTVRVKTQTRGPKNELDRRSALIVGPA